jgi:hypothetical protein
LPRHVLDDTTGEDIKIGQILLRDVVTDFGIDFPVEINEPVSELSHLPHPVPGYFPIRKNSHKVWDMPTTTFSDFVTLKTF